MPQGMPSALDDNGNPIQQEEGTLDDNGNLIPPPIEGILSPSHSQENLYTVPPVDDTKSQYIKEGNQWVYHPKKGQVTKTNDHAMEIVRGGLGTSEAIDKLRNYSTDKIGMDPYPLKGLRAGLSSMSTEPLRMIGELINDPLALATGVGAIGRGMRSGLRSGLDTPKITPKIETPIIKTEAPPIIEEPPVIKEELPIKPAKKLTLKKQAQEESLANLKTKIEQEYLDDSGNVIKETPIESAPVIPPEGPKPTTNVQEFIDGVKGGTIPKGTAYSDYLKSKGVEPSVVETPKTEVLKTGIQSLVKKGTVPVESPPVKIGRIQRMLGVEKLSDATLKDLEEVYSITKGSIDPAERAAAKVLKKAIDVKKTQGRIAKLTERLKGEEGSIIFKNPRNVDPKTADNVRNSLVESLMSGGRIDQDLIFKKVGGKLNRNQFNKIVDEVIEKRAAPELASVIKKNIPQQTPEAQSALKKLANSIIGSKGLREEQEAIYTAERGKRIGRFGKIKTRGEKGASQRMKELKGEYEKLDIEEMTLNPVERDSLFNAITDSPIDKFEKARAYNAMWKLLNGGHVPQRSELETLRTIFGRGIGESTGPGAASEFEELTSLLSEASGVPNTSAINPKDPSMLRKIWEMPRGMMSIDIPYMTSAAFRQGIGLAGTRSWFKAFADQAKVFGDEAVFGKIENELRSNPVNQSRITWDSERGRSINASIADQIGLKLADLKSLTSREEQIRSNLAERIPIYGRYVRASNRSYTTFMNSLKTNTAEEWIKAAGIIDEQGNITDLAKARRIGNTINELTGSSNLDINMPFSRWTKDARKFELEKSAEQLSTVLFSPKLMMRDMRMMNMLNYVKNDKLVRQSYLAGAIRRAGAWATFTGIAWATLGATVNDDPTSSDFGKARRGDTRVDAGAGLLQWIVLGAREVLGGRTPTDKNRRIQLGSSPISGTRQSLLLDFLINRAHPSLGLGLSALASSKSRPFYPASEAVERAVPMFTNDLVELMESDPDIRQILLGLAASGTASGSMTYGKGDFDKPTYKIPGDPRFEGGSIIGR